MQYLKICLILLIGLSSVDLYAHSGRTNASGCHNDRKNVGYRCHYAQSNLKREVSSSEHVTGTVVFNVKTKKFHRPDCRSAHACTSNCISLDKKKAIEYGGVPCRNCGG